MPKSVKNKKKVDKLKIKKELSTQEKDELLAELKSRFEKNMDRHPGLKWEEVAKKLSNKKLISLYAMQDSGGEPDVVVFEQGDSKYLFIDCSKQSPKGRRSICYDRKALEERKKHKPHDNAMDMAKEMGIEILTEEQYRDLQKIESFDTKTSSWIKTPDKIRKLGGALYADRRYDTVFIYHNGADSYYSARGFRGYLNI